MVSVFRPVPRARIAGIGYAPPERPVNDIEYIGEYRVGWDTYGWSYAKVYVEKRLPFLRFWKRWRCVWRFKRNVIYRHDIDCAMPDVLLSHYNAAIKEYEDWRAAWLKANAAKRAARSAP